MEEYNFLNLLEQNFDEATADPKSLSYTVRLNDKTSFVEERRVPKKKLIGTGVYKQEESTCWECDHTSIKDVEIKKRVDTTKEERGVIWRGIKEEIGMIKKSMLD